MPTNIGDPPSYFITEPLNSKLCSFEPQTLDNGDIRMAIACAGQDAYNMWGDRATLTEEFLSRDYKTWEDGLVSINHENNHNWVKAKIHDLEYDEEKKLVICSFSGIPEWLKSLIYSADFRGLSQECVPIEYKKNSMDVIKGYGTGCTIVTDPYEPAANQAMGVGIPPALAAILASKYPTQVEDTMVDKQGGGTPAISTEAYESIALEKVELKSRISTLESEGKKKDEEIASWKQKYDDQVSGEASRTEIEKKRAVESYKDELERGSIVSELKEYLGDDAEEYFATNPSIDTMKATLKREKAKSVKVKVEASKQIGTSQSFDSQEEGDAYESIKSRFNAKLGRA